MPKATQLRGSKSTFDPSSAVWPWSPLLTTELRRAWDGSQDGGGGCREPGGRVVVGGPLRDSGAAWTATWASSSLWEYRGTSAPFQKTLYFLLM